MTKAELIDDIAQKLGVSKRAADMAFDAVFEVIKEGLIQWHEVKIPGFGSFKPIIREARDGRNPQTGEKIRIQPKRVVKFKASKNL